MFKNRFLKIVRSLIKLILPYIYKLLLVLRINRRTINYLSEKGYFSNNLQNFTKILDELLGANKIIALDIGAQGGFNSDNFFSKKYTKYFQDILFEPIETEAKKISNSKKVINKGLWSSKETKKLYVLENRLGSSSMYKPDMENFDLHNLRKDEYKNYEVTKILNVECDRLDNSLKEIDILNIDYLKIDTQGAEFEIIKGIGEYRPLLIKIELHIFSMYKNVPDWSKVLNLMSELNYVAIDWKGIGKHSSRIPAETEMIFLPNFKNQKGKELILKNREKFISLMLIFGQINILKVIMKKLKIENRAIEDLEDFYFY
tara:strand:- start:471 stop:1418 length:948 start_codon:yes stop_codon:yes gene_type:complete